MLVPSPGPGVPGVRRGTYPGLGSGGAETQVPLLPFLLVEGAEQALQALDVLDGAAQDLHLGQPLVGVEQGAALQRLEGFVHLLQPPFLPQGGRPPPVDGDRFPFADLAGPGQALPGTMLGQG